MFDLMNDVNPKVAIAPITITDNTTLKSGAIDLAGYESCTFVIQTGTLADADATWTVTVKEGSTSTQTAHTAVADADLIGTEALAGITFADDSKAFKIGYKGGQRYCSIEIANGTANTGSAPFAVTAILGHPNSRPTANPPD